MRSFEIKIILWIFLFQKVALNTLNKQIFL